MYSFFTSITAFNFFANGGETLLVTRVASGSYSSATSSFISGSSAGSIASGSAFTLTTFSEGTIMNSTSAVDISGSLLSGSIDNIRFQIANSNTSSGTFDLYIRRGDDNTNNPIILETWTGLSLDPLAPNFLSKVIGDSYEELDTVNNQMVSYGNYKNNSRYVYVSSINPAFLMANYFDNNGTPKAAYTPFIPANLPVSGTFGSAIGTITGSANFYDTIDGTNTQGLVANQFLLKESSWFNVNPPEVGEALMDVFKNYDDYLPGARKQGEYNKEKFCFNAMKEAVNEQLAKVPDFPKQVQLKLPQLKKIELPKLQKI